MSYSVKDYCMCGIEKAVDANKKYRAVLRPRTDEPDGTGTVYVEFGDVTKEHYKDRTPLQLYACNNTGRKSVRDAFLTLNKGNPYLTTKYTAMWFEKKLLY